jgi:predicted enzyme related to lactoylglutathione lyase
MTRLTVTGTNIDAPDANALADFYRRLLGWTTRTEEPGWVVIQPEDGSGKLSFQTAGLPRSSGTSFLLVLVAAHGVSR